MGATTIRRGSAYTRQTGDTRSRTPRPRPRSPQVSSAPVVDGGTSRGAHDHGGGQDRLLCRRTLRAEPVYRRASIVPTRPAQEAVSDGAGWRQMVAAVLFTALATAGLLTTAHIRTTQVAAGVGASVVTVVREGETPAALAVRVDPDAPVDVTLARIAEMNADGLGGLTAGHRLLVPAPGRG